MLMTSRGRRVRSTWARGSLPIQFIIAAVVPAAVGLFACGNDNGASCSMTDTTGAEPAILMCEEVSANLGSQLQQACTTTGSTLPADAGVGMTVHFSDGPCPRKNSLGGCKMALGGATMTVWYYSGNSSYRTADDLKQFCATAGYSYVAP